METIPMHHLTEPAMPQSYLSINCVKAPADRAIVMLIDYRTKPYD